MLRLTCPTDPRWTPIALADLGALLVDHAHCEHKAAVTALSFVSKYPDDPVLVARLAGLARDEAGHFARVVDVCVRRGLALGHPGPDPYVQGLLAHVRKPVREQRVDRLLACALIEARSCERLGMLAVALVGVDAELAALYDDLWREEAEHHALFVALAARAGEVDLRLAELAAHEARVMQALPLRPAIH